MAESLTDNEGGRKGELEMLQFRKWEKGIQEESPSQRKWTENSLHNEFEVIIENTGDITRR